MYVPWPLFVNPPQPADLSSGAGSSEAGVVETEAGRVRVGSEAGRGDTDAGGARSHTEAEAGRGDKEAGRRDTETRRGVTDAGGAQSHTEAEAGRGDKEAGRRDTETRRGVTDAGGARSHKEAEAERGDKEAGPSVAGQELQCYGCNQLVEAAHFSEHLSDHHTQETCDTCGTKVQGTVGLLNHIQQVHYAGFVMPSMQKPTVLTSKPTPSPPKPTLLPPRPTPSLLPPSNSCAAPYHTATPPKPTPVVWKGFLPDQFRKVIQPADQVWIAKCLYEPTGQLKQKFEACWFHPPLEPKPSRPEPGWYHRQRLFIWAPMRMWGISLKCPKCSGKMNSSGIYRKVREVIDVDSRYYLVGGDYPRCSKCLNPSLLVCPWSQDILSQLDVAHRSLFPAVLTTQLALDRKAVTFLKPRTSGNSSSYVQSAMEEAHSEEWARQTIRYLSDCERHKKMATFIPSAAVYLPPPTFRPLPLAQWFETVHSNDILSHLDEMKGVITSTYGRILKMDSTKKVSLKTI